MSVFLKSTCYANAILQALSHAPELHTCLELLDYYNADDHRGKDGDRDNTINRNNVQSALEDGAGRGVEEKVDALKEVSRDEGNHDGMKKEICVLKEVECLLRDMQQTTMSQESIRPTAILDNCLPILAPEGTFRRGIQEDSHEFLRLLIDGMQKSLENSKKSNTNEKCIKHLAAQYPIQLFRGMVKSTVTCLNCGHESSTSDPMEDLTLAAAEHDYGSRTMQSITAALDNHVKAEHLEGYKCEKCNNDTAGATKATRLADMPPILTLHLKRFRYGSSFLGGVGGGYGYGIGKSGSSKIEGHIKFEEVLNITPYLVSKTRPMFCRLFAVVVHTGKNSHSGHYYAYVKSLEKNEWWKMDDSIVYPVSKEEVLSAEAYMLFYNVINHPLAVQLKEEQKKKAKEKEMKILQNTNTVKCETKDSTSDRKKRDKPMSGFDDGENWARKETKLSHSFVSVIAGASEWVADKVEWTPEYFGEIKEEGEANIDKNVAADQVDIVASVNGALIYEILHVSFPCYLIYYYYDFT